MKFPHPRFLCFLFFATGLCIADERFTTFVNPIYEGADPFVTRHSDGTYYFCQTEGDRGIAIWKSDKLSDKGTKRVVWRAPDSGWNSQQVWAPELHYVRGKWYIYYAADDGDNKNHLTGVLESATDDPQGDYIDRGIVYTGDHIETGETNRWAIDATPLETGGKLYLIWSGWQSVHNQQYLYIAEMENPWTARTNRVKMADNATYKWERVGHRGKGLNEGAQLLRKGNKIHVVYSCSGSWEPSYNLGLLTFEEGNDPMNPDNWIKHPEPVFTGNKDVIGVGHASFTTSPDGSEDWISYHSKISRKGGWQRNVRIQPFTWDANDMPVFGPSIAEGTPHPLPSGEQGPQAGGRFTDDFSHGHWDNWWYFGYNRFIDVQDGALQLGIHPSWGTANHYPSGEKALVRGTLWSNFLAQTAITLKGKGGEAGILFRVHHPAVGFDAHKGYYAGISSRNGTVFLGKMDGTNWTPIANAPFPVKPEQQYILAVATQGDAIHFQIDGKTVLDVKDASYNKGFVGLRVVDTHASFDDFKLAEQQSPKPFTPPE